MVVARGDITITEVFDGENFYRAWANSPDGKLDFATEDSDRLYMGTYVGLTPPTTPEQYQWTKVRGESAVVAILSNDAHQIGTDENGDNGNYYGAETSIAIFRGGVNDTENWNISYEVVPVNGVSGTFENNTYKVTDMSVDEASIHFTATPKTGNDSPIEKVFTLSKNKQGTHGADAKSYFLTLNDTSVKKNKETKVMEPSQLVVRGASITGDGSPERQEGYFKVFEQSEIAVDRDGYEQAYAEGLLDPEGIYTISDSNYPLVLTYSSNSPESEIIYNIHDLLEVMSVKIYWYKDPEFEQLLDVQTVLVVADGIDGVSITNVTEKYKLSSTDTTPEIDSTWKDNPMTPTESEPFLWNYETIHYSDGNHTSTEPVILSMYAKDGTSITKIDEYYALSKDVNQPADGDFTTSMKVTTPTYKYLWNKEVITLTHDDGTTTQESTYAIIGVHGEKGEEGKKGDPGENAVVMTVILPEGNAIRNHEGTLSAEVNLFEGSKAVNATSYKWQTLKGATWNNLSGSSKTRTFNADGIHSLGVFKATAVYKGVTYEQTFTLQDITDPYQISIIGADVFLNGQGFTDLTAKVYQNGDEVDTGGTQFRYTWSAYRNNGNVISSFNKSGKNIRVQASEVESITNVQVLVEEI